MESQHLVMLGRIEGKLDTIAANQTAQASKLDDMDKRLRAVEIKAATTGAIGGSIASVLLTAGMEIAKRKLGL